MISEIQDMQKLGYSKTMIHRIIVYNRLCSYFYNFKVLNKSDFHELCIVVDDLINKEQITI